MITTTKDKEKQKIQIAAWRKIHREEIAAYRTNYYKKHKKKEASQHAVYRKTHRQKISARAKIYRKSHHKEIAAYMATYMAAYYAAHQKENAAKSAAYYKIHRKKILAACKQIEKRYQQILTRYKRLHRPRSCKGVPMSLIEYRIKLFYKDGRPRRCFYCHGENNKTGGGLDRLDSSITYTFKNTVPACCGCNVWKGHTHSVQETSNHFKPMRDAARLATKRPPNEDRYDQ